MSTVSSHKAKRRQLLRSRLSGHNPRSFKNLQGSPNSLQGFLHSSFYRVSLQRPNQRCALQLAGFLRTDVSPNSATGLCCAALLPLSWAVPTVNYSQRLLSFFCSHYYLFVVLLKSSGVLAHGYLVSWHAFRTRRLHREMVSELHFFLPGISVSASSLFMFCVKGWALQISCRSH